MNLTTVSLKHQIYRAHNVLDQDSSNLILDEFKYNNWKFTKAEPGERILRGWLQTKNAHDSDGDIIGYNNQLTKLATNIQYKLQRLLIHNPLKLYRINTNIQYYGMESSFHVDSTTGKAWSFVYFIGPEWDTSWGGEFCVCTGPEDYQYIPYIPNTGVLFDASLEHMGSAPTRHCNIPRLSLAFVYHEIGNT